MTMGVMEMIMKTEHFQLQRGLLKESVSSKPFVDHLSVFDIVLCTANK